MKKILVAATLLIAAFPLYSFTWRTDFDRAVADAKREHKLVLLKFSGSDWCLPCIRMERDLFSESVFSSFADENLVMVNADFPRLEKHMPDKVTQKQNDALAEKFDKAGHFPLTILLDADGRILKTWDGYTGEKPEEFIHEIAAFRKN